MSFCGDWEVLFDGSLDDLVLERGDKRGRLEGMRMDGRPDPVSLVMVTVYRCMMAVTLSCCGFGVVVSIWCVGVVAGYSVCGGVGVKARQRNVDGLLC